LDRLHGWVVVLYLATHRSLRPRSLGNIEKSACAAFVCIPIRRVRQLTTLSYRLELIVMPRSITTLGVAALLIQHRRRFFVKYYVGGESALMNSTFVPFGGSVFTPL